MAREAFALEYIKEVRAKDPGMGGDKLWHMYRRDFKGNDPIGRDWFADIINKHNLKVRFVGDQLLICDAFGFEIPEGCRPTYTSKKSIKGKRGRPPKPQVENF